MVILSGGSNRNLLRGDGLTDFIYEIIGITLTNKQISFLNKISTKAKIKDRIEKIEEMGGKIYFIKNRESIFQNNLVLIDSQLPEILAELLKNSYKAASNDLTVLSEELKKGNPLGFQLCEGKSFYGYKIKRFLTDIVKGMNPAAVWNGEPEGNRGDFVFKKDGGKYSSYESQWNNFENYLFHNTMLESPSTKKIEYGIIEKDSLTGKCYIKLNLQIRFK